jgi:hypothetical protein
MTYLARNTVKRGQLLRNLTEPATGRHYVLKSLFKKRGHELRQNIPHRYVEPIFLSTVESTEVREISAPAVWHICLSRHIPLRLSRKFRLQIRDLRTRPAIRTEIFSPSPYTFWNSLYLMLYHGLMYISHTCSIWAHKNLWLMYYIAVEM